MRKYILAFIISIPIILLVWNMGDSAGEQNNTFNSAAEESDGKQTGILQETDVSAQAPEFSPVQEQATDNEVRDNETFNALGMKLRDDTALLVKMRKYVSPTYNYVCEEYEYDRDGRVLRHIKYFSGNKGRWEYEYDSAGNLLKETGYELGDDVARYWIEYRDEKGKSADELCRIGSRYNGEGDLTSETVYNSEGNQVRTTYYWEDGTVSWVIEYVYDDAGNLIKRVDYDYEGNIVDEWEYTYDEAGNLLQNIRNGNITTENEYNDAGNMFRSVDYDYEGNIEDEWEYTYDEDGHLLKRIHNGSITMEYEYDSAGNLTKEIADPYTQWKKYEYDSENRIIKITENLPDEGRYEYRYEYRVIEPEEQEGEKIDSISQLNIIGRTQGETNLIKEILSKHEEEFETFLMENWEYPHIQWWVGVYGYDFTGDGEEEIIVSKCDVRQDMTVSYNYVYDREGNKLLEFVGNPSNTKIINGWDGDGTFLLYITGTHAANIGAGIYTEIRWENGVLDEQVKLIEYDTRDGASQNAGKKEGYYILKDITKEEEEKLLEGAYGIHDLTETKGYVREDEDLDDYKQLFDTTETEEFSIIGGIGYWESAGFVWKSSGQSEITDSMDYSPYLRKIWIVDQDERIMADDRFDFVITQAEHAEIKGYIRLGGGVEVYYFDLLPHNSPSYCSFQGTVYGEKAECTFTYEEQQVELHLTLCENDRIEASIQCSDLGINENFMFRPYNISDEPLGDDISSEEIWLESWGTVYLVTATMDILHPYPFACLTNEKQDILYVFGYGINGSEVWDFFIEDINKDGLQDVMAVAWFDETSSYRFVNIMFQKEDGWFQKDNGLLIDGPKDDRVALSEKYYGDYQIVQFCPTVDYEEYAEEVLTEQEVNTMLGSTIKINENLLVTYDSERRHGTNKNRKMPSGDNMVVEFCDDYAYCSWRPITHEVIEDEFTFNYDLRKAVGYKNYKKIDGVIYNEAMGIQEFFTMKDEDKLIMHSLLTGQYFILDKIDG